jgi:hypothetical protein
MSWNCEYWHIYKMEDFCIPLKELMKDPGFASRDNNLYIPHRIKHGSNGQTVIEFWNEDFLLGSIDKNWFRVKEIHVCGEGSGTYIRECLDPILKHSTGILIAIRVWEDGNELELIHCKDGIVCIEDVDFDRVCQDFEVRQECKEMV